MDKFAKVRLDVRGVVIGFNIIEMSWEDIKKYARKEFNNNINSSYEFSHYGEHDGQKGIVMTISKGGNVYYLEYRDDIDPTIRKMNSDSELLHKYQDYLFHLFEHRINELVFDPEYLEDQF